MDLLEIVKLLLASFGGATVAIVALTKWLGNLWANKILEKEKAKYIKELEGEKAKYNIELEMHKNQLEIMRATLSRYGESQFSLYNALWGSLQDLKLVGDSLWEIANTNNLNRFTTQLKNTEGMINKSALLIEDEHLRKLKKLMDKFWDFRIGKKTLIELFESQERVSDEDIEAVISLNREVRDEYNNLIVDIASSFRKQLKGR